MQMNFHQVPIGARFTFFGRSYVKLALSMADDDKRDGHISQYETDVEADATDPDPQAGFPKWEGLRIEHGAGC